MFYKYLDTSKNAILFTFKKNIFASKRVIKSIAIEKTSSSQNVLVF